MELAIYLHFNGQCEAALKFYERALGAKIESMMTFGSSPMASQAPPDWGNKIMHARVKVGDYALMGMDAPPGRYQKPQGFSVSLSVKQPQEAEKLFNALSEKANITMPLQETFWAQRFGMLVDQFGIPWMVNCEKSA